MDPFVEVKIRGLDFDEANNQVYRTPVVKDNGFHPVWKDLGGNKFEFKIAGPDYCIFVFKIFD